MALFSLTDCQLVELPKISDPRGNLTFIEAEQHLPFMIKRAFYLYDIPSGESRGAHSHRALFQFLICLAGSFDVEVNDGTASQTFHLNRPWKGLLVPPSIWASEKNFDPGSVCLVLTSDHYHEADYIRDYQEFIAYRIANGDTCKPANHVSRS